MESEGIASEICYLDSFKFNLDSAVFSYDIVIPIFNEIKELRALLEELSDLAYHKFIMNIILIDDGSVDGSTEFLKGISVKDKIKIIYHEKNLGKASAIKTVQPFLTSDFVIFHDADREYPVNNIVEMIRAVEFIRDDRGIKLKHLIGVRKIDMCNFYKDVSIGSFVANKIIVSLACGVSDVFSGSRIIERNLLVEMNLNSKRFEVETEVVFKTLKRGESIYEIGVDYFPRSKIEGKKIRWYDFFKIIFMYFRIIFK